MRRKTVPNDIGIPEVLVHREFEPALTFMRQLLAILFTLTLALHALGADTPSALKVEVNATDDVLLVLSPAKGEPTELCAEMDSLQRMLDSRTYALDKVDVVIGKRVLDTTSVISQIEGVLFGKGVKRIVFRKGGGVGASLEKLSVLKDSKR